MDSSLRKGQNLRAYRASTQLHTDGTRDSHTLGWGMPLTSSKAPTASHTKKNGQSILQWSPGGPIDSINLKSSPHWWLVELNDFTTFTTIFFCSLYHHQSLLSPHPTTPPRSMPATPTHRWSKSTGRCSMDGNSVVSWWQRGGRPETLVDISVGIINLT